MEWISVKDESVEIGKAYLLRSEYLDKGKDASDMFVGYKDEEGECRICPDDDWYGWQFDDCISHFMNLPDPPPSKPHDRLQPIPSKIIS